MKLTLIERYLGDLERHLWWRGLADSRNIEEIASHLYENVDHGLASGLGLDEAQAQAIRNFGQPRRIANLYAQERLSLMQKIYLATGLAGGIFLAYIDSLPGWDDTGIVAFGLLLLSGILALLGSRRPWLLALATGLWIPLHEILFSHNVGSLLALAFAFTGAYAGWLANRLLFKLFKST